MSQIIEADKSSISPSSSPQTRRDNEDARATQVEANQLMSLQLQQQTAGVGAEEQDTSSSSDHVHSRGRPQVSDARLMSNLARFSSIASRRGPVARSSSLERMKRLRTTMFPPDMDVDTRLGAVQDIGMSAGILDAITNRDFNEGDYEMLLALDRGINHGGASSSQINGLPQSTVESDLVESCAICLETPTVGDTIRHLPCLHKFHKGCIDPWLGRRTSCPVCKLSITQ